MSSLKLKAVLFTLLAIPVFSLNNLVVQASCQKLEINTPNENTYWRGQQSITWNREDCDDKVNVYWSETKCDSNDHNWRLISNCSGLDSDYCIWQTNNNTSANVNNMCVRVKAMEKDELVSLADVNIDNTSPQISDIFTLDIDEDGLIDRLKVVFTEDTLMNNKITNIDGFTVDNHQVFFHSWRDNTLFLAINETKDHTGVTPTIRLDYNKIKISDLAGNILTGNNIINTVDQAPPVILKIYNLDQNVNGQIDSLEIQFSENINDQSILQNDSFLLDRDKIKNNNESLVDDFDTKVQYVDDDRSDTNRQIVNDEFITIKVKKELTGTNSVYLHVLSSNQVSDLAGIKLKAIDNLNKKSILTVKDVAPPVLMSVKTELADYQSLKGINSVVLEFSEAVGIDINNDGTADTKDITELNSNDSWGSINDQTLKYINGIGGFASGYMNESSNNANILQLDLADDKLKKLHIYFLTDTSAYWQTAMQGLTGKFSLNTDNIIVETASDKLDDLAKDNRLDFDVMDNKLAPAKDDNNAFDITPPSIEKIYSLDYYDNPNSNEDNFGTSKLNNGNIETIEINFSESIWDKSVNVYDFILDSDDKFNFVNETNAEFFSTATMVSSSSNQNNDNLISLAVSDKKAKLGTGAIYVHLLANSSMRDMAGNRFRNIATIKTTDLISPQIRTIGFVDSNQNGNIEAVEIEFSEAINENLVEDINLELDNDNLNNNNEVLLTKISSAVKYIDDHDELTITNNTNDNLVTFYADKEINGTDIAYLHILANTKIQDINGNLLPAMDNVMNAKNVKVYDCASPILVDVKAETSVYDGIKGFNTLSFKISENVGIDTNHDFAVDKLDNLTLPSSANWGALNIKETKHNLLNGLGYFSLGNMNESDDNANILQLVSNNNLTDQLNIYFLVDKKSYWQISNEALSGDFNLLPNNIIIEDSNYSLPNNYILKQLKASSPVKVVSQWDLTPPQVVNTLAIDEYQNPQTDIIDFGTTRPTNNSNFEAMEIQFSEAVLDLAINKSSFKITNGVNSLNPQFWSTAVQVQTQDKASNDQYLTLAVSNEQALSETDDIYLQITDTKGIRDIAGNQILATDKAGIASKQDDLRIKQISMNDANHDGKINSLELVFSKKIRVLSDIPNGVKFYTDTNFDGIINLNDDNFTINAIGNDNGDETIKFYFDENIMATGKIAISYSTNSTTPILDFKGNELQTMELLEFNDDNLAPVLVKADLIDNKQIKLSFSEVLDNSVYNKNNLFKELTVLVNNQAVKIKNVDINQSEVNLWVDAELNLDQTIEIKSLVNNLSIVDNNGNNLTNLAVIINEQNSNSPPLPISNNSINNSVIDNPTPANLKSLDKQNNKTEFTNTEWGKPYIEKMVEQGLSNLDPKEEKLINEPMNRAEFVTLVVRAFNLDTATNTDLDFADVANDAWYAPYLRAGVKANLINGTLEEEKIRVREILANNKYEAEEVKNWQRILKLLGYEIEVTGINDQASIRAIANYQKNKGFKLATGSLGVDTINNLNLESVVKNKTTIGNGKFKKMFYPSQKITRASAIKIVVLASGANTNNSSNMFTDVPSNEWFAKYVNYAADKNIVQGRQKNAFMPNDYITRAEAAKIILKMLEEGE